MTPPADLTIIYELAPGGVGECGSASSTREAIVIDAGATDGLEVVCQSSELGDRPEFGGFAVARPTFGPPTSMSSGFPVSTPAAPWGAATVTRHDASLVVALHRHHITPVELRRRHAAGKLLSLHLKLFTASRSMICGQPSWAPEEQPTESRFLPSEKTLPIDGLTTTRTSVTRAAEALWAHRLETPDVTTLTNCAQAAYPHRQCFRPPPLISTPPMPTLLNCYIADHCFSNPHYGQSPHYLESRQK